MKHLTVLEKILLAIVGTMVTAWLGWLTSTVLDISGKEGTDKAQWEAIKDLRKFHMEKK